jgi:hypothetical protein
MTPDEELDIGRVRYPLRTRRAPRLKELDGRDPLLDHEWRVRLCVQAPRQLAQVERDGSSRQAAARVEPKAICLGESWCS